MRLKSLLYKINNILPQDSGIEGDRIGLQIQAGRSSVSNILITLEVTRDVIKEAKKLKCDCIITFHPLIYNPLKTINDDDRVGELSALLIKNSIALISIHTAFDAYIEGTSKIFADKLGFKFEEFLIKSDLYDDRGIGIVASVSKPIDKLQLLKKIHSISNSPVKHSAINKKIKKIAVVGGSGSEFINDALAKKVDAYITADLTYHHYHKVNDKMILIDPGHYEMEQFVPLAISKLFNKYLKEEKSLKIKLSDVLTNPVKYYPDGNYYYGKQKKYLMNSLKKLVQN